MAWTECRYSRSVIDEAGKKLATLPSFDDPEMEQTLEVINNWRSCHSYPLHIIMKTLRSRANSRVNHEVLTARRIKRLPSIALKLEHNRNMKLSQMQDIGGCRAVVKNIKEINQLWGVYREATAKHPNASDRPFIHKTFDYVAGPKSDGYRGIHLIMKYQSNSKDTFNGQRIEIQIRTQLQHAWATSVETCQAFTGQALKSKIKTASDDWIRFFSLMSSAIAAREKSSLVPGTPISRKQRKEELLELESRLQISTMLSGWHATMIHPIVREDKNVVVLLELDTMLKELKVSTYPHQDLPRAHAEYLNREKATQGNPAIQVALVSSDSISSLRRAYPNFYVDTSAFLKVIRQELYSSE